MFVAVRAGSLCIPYLGLNSQTYEWLVDVGDRRLAEFRRQALLIGLNALSLPHAYFEAEISQQVEAVLGAALDRNPQSGPTIIRIPCGLGHDCGSGHAFSRDPDSGSGPVVWTYTAGAELDWPIERGVRMSPIDGRRFPDRWAANLRREMLASEVELGRIATASYVVERGELTLCSARGTGNNSIARTRSSMRLLKKGLISRQAALAALEPGDLDGGVTNTTGASTGLPLRLLATGFGTSPGIEGGVAAFTATEALRLSHAGIRPILILEQSHPADLKALLSSAALVTTSGGVTSHAAVVARGLGIPCISALPAARLDPVAGRLELANGRVVLTQDEVTVDGNTGRLYEGFAPDQPRRLEEVGLLHELLPPEKSLDIGPALHVNIDDATALKRAIKHGAEGVGLCRIENLLLRFEPNDVETPSSFSDAIKRRDLARFLADEIEALLEAADGLPVNIRLLDPSAIELPLAGFDYNVRPASCARHSEAQSVSVSEPDAALGLRGIRRNIGDPALAGAQVSAILEAVRRSAGRATANVCLLLPMVTCVGEVLAMKAAIKQRRTNARVSAAHYPLRIGAMIETPRAALIAGQIAQVADLLSFGTNDLTAFTWAMSRETGPAMIDHYLRIGCLGESPFERFDADGVGQLMRYAIGQARAANPRVLIGSCGELSSRVEGLVSLLDLDLDYVSCHADFLLSARAVVGFHNRRHVGTAQPTEYGKT